MNRQIVEQNNRRRPGGQTDGEHQEQRRRRRHPDQEEEGLFTMPLELVLHIASFVSTRKLYLTLLSLNRELWNKGKETNNHPLFEWPRVSLTSPFPYSASLAFSSDTRHLLQAKTDDSEGLTLRIWDNIFGPGPKISIDPFWKSISNPQARPLAEDQDRTPSAYEYHGTFSKDGRYLLVAHGCSEESPSVSLYFFSRVFCLVDDAGNDAPPKFDPSNYVDLHFLDGFAPYFPTWKRSSFSPNNKYVLVEFLHLAFVWNIETQECVQRIMSDEKPHESPICCANGYTVWVGEGHNVVLSPHGTDLRWTFDGWLDPRDYQIQHFIPHPTDPSILVSTTNSALYGPIIDSNSGDFFREEATLSLWKAFVQSDTDPVPEDELNLQYRRSLDSRSEMPYSRILGLDLRIRIGGINQMRWNNDGSQLLFHRFNRLCVAPGSLRGANDNVFYSRLVQSANATMDNLFDWGHHYIKDFQMSPDCRALVVHIGDSRLPEQKEQIVLFPLHPDP